MTIFSNLRNKVEILKSQFKQLEYINNLKITEPFNATINGYNYMVLYDEIEKKDFINFSAYDVIKNGRTIIKSIINIDFNTLDKDDQYYLNDQFINVIEVLQNCIQTIGGLNNYNLIRKQSRDIEEFYNNLIETNQEVKILIQDNNIHKSIIKEFDLLFTDNNDAMIENTPTKTARTKAEKLATQLSIDIELLKYFDENFICTTQRGTELTKYNAIFKFLNDKSKIQALLYKELIFELFGFDYNKRELRQDTEIHTTQLNTLEYQYKDSKKSSN